MGHADHGLTFRELLGGGDRRGIGHADLVSGIVVGNPKLFQELLAGLWSEDAVVRMRAADAAEKVTRNHGEMLQAYKKELLGLMAEAEQKSCGGIWR